MNAPEQSLECRHCRCKTTHTKINATSWVCNDCGGFYKDPRAEAARAEKAQEAFEAAASRGPELSDFTPVGGPRGQLPVTFRDGSGKLRLRGAAGLVTPDGKDIADFSRTGPTCGSCRKFDLEAGRKEIVRQNLGSKLVHDYEWQIKHLGATIESLGLCGESGGTTLTSVGAAACDHYRER